MFGEDLGNIITREMAGRPGIVRGPLASDLSDPITNIRLNDFDAMLDEKGSKADLLGNIRFRFDHESLLTDFSQQDFTGLL